MKSTIESIDRAMQHITLIDELEKVIDQAVKKLDFAQAERVQIEQLKSVREVSKLQIIAERVRETGVEMEVVKRV